MLDYLGMDLSMDEEHIMLSMSEYIDKTLEIMDMTNIKVASTPINAPIEPSEPLDIRRHKLYLVGMGCVGWLVNTGRPDVAYAHSRSAQHCANPTETAWTALTRIMAYLKGAKNWCIGAPLGGLDQDISALRLQSSHTRPTEDWEFYCDSDHAGNSETQNKRRSQNGTIATLTTAPVFWASKVTSIAFAHPDIKEAHADTSSGAVEIYCAGNAANDVLHLSYVADEMGLHFPKPAKLKMDNSTAEVFTNNSAFKSKLKHIDTRQEWVQILRNKDILVPVHVDTKLNIADIFTKILSKEDFYFLRGLIMMIHTVANQ
jgi:hypothetical protein